ncbi:MAG: zinc ribbon domain-containing protein [bacterium]|nr:MAG: zinc ribbon domain-containing protein [bacterium]
MPIYEYKCKKCENLFDVIQSIGASNENLNCPTCGEPKPVRIFSTFGAGSASVSAYSLNRCSSTGPFT